MKFYSESLKEMFDTEAALVEAEAAAAKKAEEKAEAAKIKKAEAKEVEDAFKARNTAKKAYSEKILELRKKYAEDIAQLKSTLDTEMAAAAEEYNKYEKAYDEKLSAFIKNHPEGYHMTLKDGDNIVNLKSTSTKDTNKNINSFFDLFDNLLSTNWFFN